MPCPNCTHTMHSLGKLESLQELLYWCPRCGTIRRRPFRAIADPTAEQNTDEAPRLVERVQELIGTLLLLDCSAQLRDPIWTTGVAESVGLTRELVFAERGGEPFTSKEAPKKFKGYMSPPPPACEACGAVATVAIRDGSRDIDYRMGVYVTSPAQMHFFCDEHQREPEVRDDFTGPQYTEES